MKFAIERVPDAHTATLGVVGYPVGHSLSPLLQNALLSYFGLEACYHAFVVQPSDLLGAIRGASALNFLGLNVTVPHKERAASVCDELSPDARLLGAVNTLVFRRDGSIYGANTDPYGFRKAVGFLENELNGGGALVLGAGGAARAVVLALATLGASTIWIANRTWDRAAGLVKKLSPGLPTDVRLVPLPLDAGAIQTPLNHCALVVNATSAGMRPDVASTPLPRGAHFAPGAAVVDLVYNPLETRFLREAKEAGCFVANGLEMLIHQAVASLEIWFSRKLEVDVEFLLQLRKMLQAALRDAQR